MIKEDLLHYVWKTKKFNLNNLFTEDGKTIEILDFGIYNYDAGPDFFKAKIKIDRTTWVGNVEMHVFSSDWIKHNHSNDPAYENVILHVVYENDKDISFPNRSVIPCLVLKNRIPQELSQQYLRLIQSENWVPCQPLICNVETSIINIWLEKLSIERIQSKTESLRRIWLEASKDWDQSFFILLMKSFGTKVNSIAFEQLGKSIPYLIIQKNRDNVKAIEALLFGQAGFLDFESNDQYVQALKTEYSFLSRKYGLVKIPKTFWKFLRMRPANFPTIRLAQYAGLLKNRSNILSAVLTMDTINHLYDFFVIDTTHYWDTHYMFEKESTYKEKKVGKSMVDLIIINTIVPFMFLYGEETGQERYKLKALGFLKSLKRENNKITRKWAEIGIEADTADQSQALIQLKNSYCFKKRCLDCLIGHNLLKQKDQ